LVSPEQAVVILVSIFGMNQDDAERIAKGAPKKSVTQTGGESAPAPQEPVAEAPAIDEPTPVNPEKDPNAGPDAELAAKPQESVKEVLSESFTMRDDPDFNLSSKELDMVAKAVGLKDKKPRTTRKK
jgi:hypothetical protein